MTEEWRWEREPGWDFMTIGGFWDGVCYGQGIEPVAVTGQTGSS